MADRAAMMQMLAEAKARSKRADATTERPGPFKMDWADVGKSTASGIRSGLESTLGSIGDIGTMQQGLASYGASKLGLDPEKAATLAKYTSPFSLGATTEDVNAASDKLFGRDEITRHEATTPEGKHANVASNLLSGLVGGPENFGKDLALKAATLAPHLAPSAKAIFVGLASKMAPKEGLKIAEEMLAKGASREEALKATGWFQQHGDWKYEIGDKDAKLTGPAMDKLLGSQGTAFGYGPDIIDHPELFRAHPTLDRVPISTQISNWDQRGGSGQFHPETGIKASGDRTHTIKDVTLHELQHAVQTAENFPRGGNPLDNSLVPLTADLRDKVSQTFKTFDDERRAYVDAKIGDKLNDVSIDGRERLAMLQGVMDEWAAANPEKAKMRKLALENLDVRGPRAGYKHLAGEVEARNVQRRQDFTSPERREIAPWETQDVPDELQIVRRRADQPAQMMEPTDRLPGAPAHVEGPVPQVASAASDYAGKAGIDLKRQQAYADVSPRRGRYIAKAYDKMQHAPDDPKVKASYQALADETMAQWHALQDAGAKIDFMKPGQADPYPRGPRDALADLRANHHLSVFPSEQGFGTVNQITDNPLLAPTGITHNGHPMVVNDAFRAVHDYFGHGMEGAAFGPRGEENAWLSHKRLFSPEALPALTSETRGQNSWVNFGPHGEANQANPRDTVFADQKTGLLPAWATREGGMPLSYRAQQAGTVAALLSALALRSSGNEGQR